VSRVDETERALIASLRLDRAPASSRDRMLVAVGLSAPGAFALVSKHGLFAKLGLGVVGLATVALVSALLHRPAPEAKNTQPAVASTIVQAPTQTTIPIETPPSAVVVVPSAIPMTAPIAVSKPKAKSTLADETALIDGIRNALQKGDGARAKTLLQQHDTEFPQGVLAPEAEVFWVKTWMMLGDVAKAKAKAAAIEERMPGSIYAERAAALVDG
jgi:hypothetical protein